MIAVEIRPIIFAEPAPPRWIEPGRSIADMLGAFALPPEFQTHGAVILHDPRRHGVDEYGHPQGEIYYPEAFRAVRPRDGAAMLVTLMPRDLKGGNVWQLIASIALVAVVAWATAGGGLAFLAPAVFAGAAGSAGSIAVAVAGAGIAIGGSTLISMLTRPAAGIPMGGGGGGPGAAASLGQAGIGGNPIGLGAQIPWVAGGPLRVSPPMLRPHTMIVDNDQWVHAIYFLVGPLLIENIKINETDIADLPAGTIEYETREGFDDDAELTLITQSVFEETPNIEMSRHRTAGDGRTLIEPFDESYPKPHTFKTVRRTNRFRLILSFPGGLYTDDGLIALLSFRMRFRVAATLTEPAGAWVNLPEMFIQTNTRGAFREEVWLVWGGDEIEEEIQEDVRDETSLFVRVYSKNPEWTAATYFNAAPESVDANADHTFTGKDQIFFHLHADTFEIGPIYDVEITRSAAQKQETAGFTDTAYGSTASQRGLFSFSTTTDVRHFIPFQHTKQATTVIQSYASFRDEYPITQRGLTLIAIKAKNIQLSSVSAEYTSYVPDTGSPSGVIASNNPADLLEYVRTGKLNARPISGALIEDSSDWRDFCVANDLTFSALIDRGTVDQLSERIANAGCATLRNADKYGVIIDNSRSDETVACVFTPQLMTQPLKIKRSYLITPRALYVTFSDPERDYAPRMLDQPVFDDGVAASFDMLTEQFTADGATSEAQAILLARLHLRRIRHRLNRYTWGSYKVQLDLRKGSLVGLGHDLLLETFCAGLVKSFATLAGNLVSVTLDNEVQDAPATSYSDLWGVPDALRLSDLFSLAGVQVGMQIWLADGSVAIIPVSGVSGATLNVEGTVATPAELEADRPVAVGPRGSESRRVILSSITHRNDLHATLEAVDEAPGIHAGLLAA